MARRDGGEVTLAHEMLDALRQRVRGPLLTPDDPGFESATKLWNGMIQKQPALVVRPTGTADVVAAVDFARQNGLALSVRGGGHNIAGTSIAHRGLTIDMSSLRGVVIDPATRLASVQGGCVLGDVDREAQLHGLAFPLGFFSDVGVAGLTLGGGFGYLTRRFGLAVDNLLGVEIVTADGRVQHASRIENDELFWAIRGAGANLGAVTSFQFRLHPVGPMIYGGLIAWPFERADEILRGYRTLTTIAPRELTAFLILMRAPAAPFVPLAWQGRRICAMTVCYSGDPNLASAALAPIRALEDPIFDLLGPRPYVVQQSYLNATEPKGAHYYWKTEFASELSDELLSAYNDLFASCPMPEGELVIIHLGGAINEHESDDGAVGNRDARYAYGAAGMWRAGEPRVAEFKQWVHDAWRRIRAFSTGGNYINFQTADESDERIRATYGANFERLLEIKRKYDPENLFRSNRNIRA